MENPKVIHIAGSTSTIGKAFLSSYGNKYYPVLLNREDLNKDLPMAKVLINCIGDVNLIGLEETSDNAFESMIDANLRVPFMLARRFISTAGKHIINIGSTRSLSPAPGKAIYSATKTALRSLTQSINLETETKATLICPGSFAEEGTIEATVNAIHFCIQNPEVKEIIINGQI